MAITSINIPMVGGSRHVTVVDADTGIPLPPSGISWMSSPNASGLVTVMMDPGPSPIGFTFTALSAGSWQFTATWDSASHPHALLAVSVGPDPTNLGFTSP